MFYTANRITLIVGSIEDEMMMKPPCFDVRTKSNVSTNNMPEWKIRDMNERLACCKMFSELFDFENLETIMKMMKVSLGQPLPRSLKVPKPLNDDDMRPIYYEQIFPSSEYLRSLKNMR